MYLLTSIYEETDEVEPNTFSFVDSLYIYITMKISVQVWFFLKHTFQFIVGEEGKGGKPAFENSYNPIRLCYHEL